MLFIDSFFLSFFCALFYLKRIADLTPIRQNFLIVLLEIVISSALAQLLLLGVA